MLHLLKRHPLPMRAFFEHVLVLAYAVPETVLRPLLLPGLVLDTYESYGFLAIAMVQTRNLRPTFAPKGLSKDFFLTGYRIFTRFRTGSGRVLRGLRILRSDTDSRWMARWGNRLTYYRYQKAEVDYRIDHDVLEIRVHTPRAEANLHVRAYLASQPAPLPAGSPFPDVKTALRFAGPLPFTFDFERETGSVIRVQGVRENWDPITTRVEVLENTFIEREPFAMTPPILASAFHLANVSYSWKRGVRERVT
jgi:hypothetical protein